MGFLPQEDVPAFFLIEDAQFVGSDTDGNEVHRGTRIDISVEDEIAENGPRLPIFEASQKDFNIGFIGIVQPGRAPSQQLLERMMGIRRAFFDYWSAATGGVSTMNDALQRTLQFAQLGNGEGLASDIVLTNPSATETVSGHIDFFDDNGSKLPVGITDTGVRTLVNFSVPPLAEVTVSTDGQGDVVVGSAVVTADNVLGGAVRFDLSGIGIAGVGSSPPLIGFVAPVRRLAGGINTGVAIYNMGSQAVTLNLTLRNPQGEVVPNGTRTITDFPVAGHLAQFFGGDGEVLFPDADTDDFAGTLVVEVTGGRVAATALELGTEAGQFTTLSVTPTGAVTSTPGKLYFADFANGSGLTSELVLVNPSASDVISGRVDFFDGEGLPLLMGLAFGEASCVEFEIPALGTTTIASDGQGQIAVGSAVVSSEKRLGGVVRFDISGIGIAGVGSSERLEGFITPVRRQLEGINTGVAIHNIESHPVTLSLTLRDKLGTPVSKGDKDDRGLPGRRTTGPVLRRRRGGVVSRCGHG